MGDCSAWKIDDDTFLVRNSAGPVAVWWAGCLMTDFMPLLSDVVESPLVERCERLILGAPSHRLVIAGVVDVANYGEGFSVTLCEIVPA